MKRRRPHIVKVCRACGCGEGAHAHQGPYDVSFGPGRSVKAYKLHCRVCKTQCGLSNRVLS